MPQTGIVFSQKTQTAPAWPGAGDVDDCWVVSGLQCANAAAPWLPLYSVTTFRKAAGDPDDGQNDGGNPDDIYAGLVGCYPAIKPYVRKHKGASWTAVRARYDEGRPISLCVIAAGLPAGMRFGFEGAHQVSICRDNDENRFANPLAKAQTRWQAMSGAEFVAVRDAALAYGKARSGTASIYAVSLPTTSEALTTHPLFASAAAKWCAAHPAPPVPDPDSVKRGREEMRLEAIAAATALVP